MEDMKLFITLIHARYQQNPSDFPMVSIHDIQRFNDHITSLDLKCYDANALYDPILDSLLLSSLADLLYIKKYKILGIAQFHPNYMKYSYFDGLVLNKASVTVGYFKFFVFSPSTAPMDVDKIRHGFTSLIHDPFIHILLSGFLTKLQIEGNRLDQINVKNTPTRGLGLLYFMFLDLYIDVVDKFIHDRIQINSLDCFWCRCLDTAILCFADKKRAAYLYKEVIRFDVALPTWGLTAKVRSGTKGGKVLRPWNGKLYINTEGRLQWCRPESIIEM